ncbi:MAG: hypothetical protein L0Z54_04110 [Thermoplasmata archaeon]|nr:hypothetical protein [Thermoplasmata archaeon]
MVNLEVELFFSLSDPNSAEVRRRVMILGREHGIAVRETLAAVHRFRSWRMGVKAVPTLQVGRKTVWVGSAPDGVLERIFEELASSNLAPLPAVEPANVRPRGSK